VAPLAFALATQPAAKTPALIEPEPVRQQAAA
jgi:hypothetical protein